MATKVKKPTKLELANERIKVLEERYDSLQTYVHNQRDIVLGLVGAVKPFAFASEPNNFQGTDTNLTPCHVADRDVQRLRRILSEIN